MDRELTFTILSVALGACVFTLHIVRALITPRLKRPFGYVNIALHIILFVFAFFRGASLEVILLIMLTLVTLYFLLEYIGYKKGGGV